MVFNFTKPRFKVIESCSICDGVAEKDSICSSVENLCDRAECFLTSCVPDLELEACVLNLDAEWSEFHPDCTVVFWVESVMCQAVKNARFSHPSISKDNYFFRCTCLAITCVSKPNCPKVLDLFMIWIIAEHGACGAYVLVFKLYFVSVNVKALFKGISFLNTQMILLLWLLRQAL